MQGNPYYTKKMSRVQSLWLCICTTLCAKLSQVSCLFFKTSHYKGKTSYLADQFSEIQTWVLKYKRGSSLETAQISAFVLGMKRATFPRAKNYPLCDVVHSVIIQPFQKKIEPRNENHGHTTFCF